MPLTKKGTAWVLVPRLCLYFTSSHKMYKHYLIPSSTFPLKEENDLCSVLGEKRCSQDHSLDVHPLNSPGFLLSEVPNLRAWLEVNTVFGTFPFSILLLTILKHLLTQHLLLLRHRLHRKPHLGHQGIPYFTESQNVRGWNGPLWVI